MAEKQPMMVVDVTGGGQNLQEDLPYYHKIIDAVTDAGHVIARNWIDPTYAQMQKGNTEVDWQAALDAHMESITRADLAIIEGSHYSFGPGYYTAVALQQKKPVLFISRNKEASKRLVSGIVNDLFTLATYETVEDLEEIVKNFIYDNTLASKDLRFNFFIDRDIYNHLRWVSSREGKTKAEILRELVQKEIDNENFDL
jgi:hypothetical protein